MIIYYTLSYSGRHEDSHKLLRDAIAVYTGDGEKAGALVSRIKKGKNGKPYIDGFDHFSISHSHNAWAVLFDDRECGLDIQYEKKCDVVSIAQRWYAAEDAKLVKEAYVSGDEEGLHLFFRIWTRREALAKALGGTVYDSELPAVSLHPERSEGSQKEEILRHCVPQNDTKEKLYAIKEIFLPGAPELHAAVCVRGRSIPEIRMMQLPV